MENLSTNYIEVTFKGIDDNCFCQGKYEIKSKYFNQIEFINEHTTRFYFTENLGFIVSKVDLDRECRDILLKLYIQLLKEGSYFIGRFEIDKNNIKIQNEYATHLSLCDSVSMLDSISVERHDNLDKKDRIEIDQKRVAKTLSDSVSNEVYLSDGNSEKLLKLFQINDPIIQYFLMYSWLCDLCDMNGKQQQASARNFIEASKIYKEIPQNQKRRKRKDEQGRERDEDIFTYLRNLIGHSVNDILNIKDRTIIGEIETYKRKFLLILLEKISGT